MFRSHITVGKRKGGIHKDGGGTSRMSKQSLKARGWDSSPDVDRNVWTFYIGRKDIIENHFFLLMYKSNYACSPQGVGQL